jgi:RNA polymerase sigma factor (sigma-70 family)
MAEIPPTRPSLLVRLRDRGDEFAWSQFIGLYGPLVYGYARKQGLQDADAADLTQETLGAVTSAVGRLEYDPNRGAFRNWLFTIVRRALSKWQRAQKNQAATSRSQDDALLKQHPQPEADQAEWETRWQERLFAWACERVRPEVTADTWRAFWRTAIDDQSGKQVAAELGMSVAAVYRARSRVMARLKAEVQRVQEEESGNHHA